MRKLILVPIAVAALTLAWLPMQAGHALAAENCTYTTGFTCVGGSGGPGGGGGGQFSISYPSNGAYSVSILGGSGGGGGGYGGGGGGNASVSAPFAPSYSGQSSGGGGFGGSGSGGGGGGNCTYSYPPYTQSCTGTP